MVRAQAPADRVAMTTRRRSTSPQASRRPSRARRAGRRAAVLGLLLVVFTAGVLGALTISSSSAAASEIAGTWESGGYAPFSGLECPNPARQFTLVTAPVREGSRAARFNVTGADVWSNGTVRCLAAKYDSNETTGMDSYFHVSMYIPSPGISGNLIWELHHPSSLYNLSACGVAPFAITTDGSRLLFRIATGDCNVGKGWSYWEPNIPIPGLSPYPKDRWIDIVVHIRFAESATGVVEVWSRTAGSAWPVSPQIERRNIPTMPFSSSAGVRNAKLYTEMGLYPGYAGYSGNDTIYLDDYRRESSLAAAQAGGVAPAPAPSTTATTTPAPAPSATTTATTTPAPAPSATTSATTTPAPAPSATTSATTTPAPAPSATTPTPAPAPAAAAPGGGALAVSSSLKPARDHRTLTWSALVTGTASRVEFFVDGRLRWTEYSSPWVYNGDRGTLSAEWLGRGKHTLTVKAVAADGASATVTSIVTVQKTRGRATFASPVTTLGARKGASASALRAMPARVLAVDA
jgi:hypothetical protein